MNKESISVSALNRYVKLLLESDEILSQLWIEGEISNLVVHRKSGHMYFSLKDADASVKAVMFRGCAERLRFVPEDGMRVVARCKVSLYERDGAFQIYCEDLTPLGVGTAQAQLQALAEKLGKEGLFAPERKRPLAVNPKVIAVVTSSSGAAVRDIIQVAARRNPFVTLRIYPVNVQGIYAARSIIGAIGRINASEDVDEVIISRGGGSKEDLWIFNDENLVRAACTLRVPFISAVGHEIDTTLLDHAADLRAPTPSAAAELAVSDASQRLRYAVNVYERTRLTLTKGMEERETALSELRLGFRSLSKNYYAAREEKLEAAAALCRALDPLSVLLRGYSVAMLGGHAISSVEHAKIGDTIELKLADGILGCEVLEVHKHEV